MRSLNPQAGHPNASAFVAFTASVTAYVRVSRAHGSVQITLPMSSR